MHMMQRISEKLCTPLAVNNFNNITIAAVAAIYEAYNNIAFVRCLALPQKASAARSRTKMQMWPD